jgi:hypothetical protein
MMVEMRKAKCDGPMTMMNGREKNHCPSWGMLAHLE